jgi:DNA-binding NarL/FixJ family response regulator
MKTNGDRPSAPAADQDSAQKKNRIFLVDDHPIVQQALAEMLNHEPDLEVCGSAQTASSALEQIEKLRPDLIILDLSLQGGNGIELLKDIRVRCPKQLVLMLSMHNESVYAFRALRAGAVGYIMKAEATERLLLAVRRVLDGGVYLSDRIQKGVLGRLGRGDRGEPEDPLQRLSDREMQVLQLVGQGRSTRQIAAELHLSVKTIESHRAHLKEKLNLKTGTDLVRYAIQFQDGEMNQPFEAATTLASTPQPAGEVV